MDRRTFLEFLSALAVACKLPHVGTLADADAPGLWSESWSPSSTPIPVPLSVVGSEACSVSLNGAWQFLTNPAPHVDFPGAQAGHWVDVTMPNELYALGHVLAKDYEYPLRRKVRIPAGFADHRVFLRFEGVYSYARVWINGHFVREHFGGFTAWDCEITAWAQPGSEVEIVVGVTDRSDDISQASYYAKHVIAGILRDVQLVALPKSFVRHLHLESGLDSKYRDGRLQISALLNEPSSESSQLRIQLRDADHRVVPLERSIFEMKGVVLDPVSISVPSPHKWDSEHPYLYTLTVEVWSDGARTETIERAIGFRKVERNGNQLLVNGQPVLLRGVCRHTVHPTMGRAVPEGTDENDARLLRAANINFVRTSHYPPSEQFLAACDHHGIYVEEETAVCWSSVEGGPSSDPAFTDRFIKQFREMLARDHWHPSVLFWSLGNESRWGSNITEELHFARRHDPSRPLIFSYPDSADVAKNQYDIYSKHYAAAGSDLGSSICPVLHDEFAHVACYNTSALALDPGIRNFWGESIKRFADEFAATSGCLGGSIWAGIDEVFLFAEEVTGYGPWGILDGWRREKPEYWLTRKAYSPVRISDDVLPHPGEGQELALPVRNAFDHTDFSELAIECAINNETPTKLKLQLTPHATGVLKLPARAWKNGDIVSLNFANAQGVSVDRYALPVGERRRERFDSPPSHIEVTESADGYTVSGTNFSVFVSRVTGLIENAKLGNTTLIESGPCIDLGRGRTRYWLLKRLNMERAQGKVVFHGSGEGKHGEGMATVKMDYELEVSGDATVRVRYRLTDQAGAGGASAAEHVGVGFLMPAQVDRIAWHRKALWSVYPEDHIGRARGTAMRSATHSPAVYAQAPDWPWSQDTHDFFLQGRKLSEHAATNDFRALKEHVYFASCVLAGSEARLRVEANADVAVRAAVEADGRVLMTAFSYWHFPSLQWGNYTGVSAPPASRESEAVFRLADGAEKPG